VAVGILVATLSFAIGFDANLFRITSAVVLAGIGIVLVCARLQAALVAASSALGQAVQSALSRLIPRGLFGQFVVGVLLGAGWPPASDQRLVSLRCSPPSAKILFRPRW
jgi:cytochrome c biogenesis protein CcdA